MTLLESVAELGPRIRAVASDGERNRRLDPTLVRAFGDAGLWSTCAPRSVGGLELPLAEQLELFEEIARADGATGWCAMIAATSSLVYAHLEPDVARGLVGVPTGGVFAPSGRARPTDEGLIVDGRWSFASGVDHCARLGLGVVVSDGDQPRTLDNGATDVRAVLIDAGDYEILDTWDVSGLRGTGSHDVAVSDLLVPPERTYVFVNKPKHHDGPLYRFPLFGVLALAVASVSLGIARSSIEELTALATAKRPTGSRRRLAERSFVQMEVARAEAELRAARALFFDAVGRAWQRAEEGAEPTLHERAGLRLAATHAGRTAATVVDRMYEAGGGTSIYATSRLQRDFRDVHAATQHAVIAPATLELAGRILLGVETDVSQL